MDRSIAYKRDAPSGNRLFESTDLHQGAFPVNAPSRRGRSGKLPITPFFGNYDEDAQYWARILLVSRRYTRSRMRAPFLRITNALHECWPRV